MQYPTFCKASLLAISLFASAVTTNVMATTQSNNVFELSKQKDNIELAMPNPLLERGIHESFSNETQPLQQEGRKIHAENSFCIILITC